MRLTILFLTFAISSISFGQLIGTPVTVDKGAAEKYLKGPKTDMCVFTYYFEKDSDALGSGVCAINASYGGGVNATTFCDLITIDLNTGLVKNFSGSLAQYIGELKIQGECSKESVDKLISDPVLGIIAFWNNKGYAPVVAKDIFNYKDSFESKIKKYSTPDQKKNTAPINKKSKVKSGWVFTKLKSSQAYEGFKPCERVKADFENHLQNESRMWSSHGAVCEASSFGDDRESIFECKYPNLGDTTRYYFWHEGKAKCEARLKTVKQNWK